MKELDEYLKAKEGLCKYFGIEKIVCDIEDKTAYTWTFSNDVVLWGDENDDYSEEAYEWAKTDRYSLFKINHCTGAEFFAIFDNMKENRDGA